MDATMWTRRGEIDPSALLMPYALVGVMPTATAANRREVEDGGGTRIGARTILRPYSIVYTGVEIGADCLVAEFASIREQTRIGDRCVISRHVSINYEVEIGNDVRIMDGTHITGRCKIGDGTFIGVGVVTSNDRRIDLDDYQYRAEHVRGPIIGRNCVIGSGANLLAGITIGDGAVIAAGAVVVKDVPPGAVVFGPAAQARPGKGPSLDEIAGRFGSVIDLHTDPSPRPYA